MTIKMALITILEFVKHKYFTVVTFGAYDKLLDSFNEEVTLSGQKSSELYHRWQEIKELKREIMLKQETIEDLKRISERRAERFTEEIAFHLGRTEELNKRIRVLEEQLEAKYNKKKTKKTEERKHTHKLFADACNECIELLNKLKVSND